MGRILIYLGVTLVAVGVLWNFGAKLGLGKLPGDMMYEKGNMKVYFPLGSSIAISVVLTLVLWIIGNIRR
ncbi:MAG: DUF2905 domain-containing protein [Oligoflexales bacterium]